MTTATKMTDAEAYAYAEAHPELVVLVERESMQGRMVWLIRPDGTRECQGAVGYCESDLPDYFSRPGCQIVTV